MKIELGNYKLLYIYCVSATVRYHTFITLDTFTLILLKMLHCLEKVGKTAKKEFMGWTGLSNYPWLSDYSGVVIHWIWSASLEYKFNEGEAKIGLIMHNTLMPRIVSDP